MKNMVCTTSACLTRKIIEKSAEIQTERLADIGSAVVFVAHEMRNALQRVSLGIDMIRPELRDGEENIMSLEQIRDGVDTLNTMVGDLLDYSKPLNLAYSLCTVGDVIDVVLEQVMHKLRDVSVYMDIEEEDREIALDCDRIVQVLVNIIRNAVDAMPDGGSLMIASRVRREGDTETLKISITDSGCGMDEMTLIAIQEPFVTTKSHGAGLGIPICKKIMTTHKGSFDIRSTVGIGTTAEITLPVENQWQ
jgi:signal transduction histidine kinase